MENSKLEIERIYERLLSRQDTLEDSELQELLFKLMQLTDLDSDGLQIELRDYISARSQRGNFVPAEMPDDLPPLPSVNELTIFNSDFNSRYIYSDEDTREKERS